MSQKKPKIHFIGIAGFGMSGIAEYYLMNGYTVSGSDLVRSPIINRLEELGAKICIGHSADNFNGSTKLVVYSSAISPDNPEMIKAQNMGIEFIKRAEALGRIVNEKFLISVSGTHGKTTTTAMIGKILIDAGLDPTIFVGGNVSYLNGGTSRVGQSNIAVVEADEYDRSFWTLNPDLVVITNIDNDHLDIYKDLNDIKSSFNKFCSNSKKHSIIVYCGDDENIPEVISNIERDSFSYGYNKSNYYRISDYKVVSERINFSIYNSHSDYKDISINLLGKHNMLNASASFVVSKLMNIDFNKFRSSMDSFSTVDRRLQIKYNRNEIKIFDDYAHHPKEIEASLKALRELNGGKWIISVFQPHLFSRTKDFYKEFAQALSLADEIVLTDIYPARESPIQGVTSSLIFNEIRKIRNNCLYMSDKQKLFTYLVSNVKNNDIVVFQGAGDISVWCDQFISKLKDVLN
jgi:UDP-N-acetylmuramate--alanine ligase